MAIELLLEGGLYGHLNHLYDNPDLPFAVIKKIFNTASSGELVGTEKTDGQNLYISYSVAEGKAKAARNKGNIKQGGMDATALAVKFGGRGALEKAFTESFAAFEQAVSQFSPDEQVSIFGEDANVFYNAEIMDPANANVINYDTKSLVIHQQGHSEFDRKTGNVTDADVSKNVDALAAALENVQQETAADKFTVQMNAMKTLQKLDGDTALREAEARLDKLVASAGLSDKNTIGEFLVAKVKPVIDQKFPNLPNDRKKLLQKRIMGVKGTKVTDITKGIRDKQLVADIKGFVSGGKEFMGKIIAPLESIVHDFSVEMLRGLESAYILDNNKEIQRLASEVETARNAIEGSGRDDVMLVMTKHLQKLSDITTATEGFVFDWDGVTYKFTGNFAPANQILGMFKYGRGKMPAIQKEVVNEEAGGRRVAVVPGGFKPPHAGHFLGAKWFLDKNKADEVHVLVSPKKRVGHSSDGKSQVVITKEMSLAVWNKYIDEHGLGGQMHVSVSKNDSPVGAAYDFMAELSPGDVILLGKGEKDECDTRFNRAQEWSDKKGYGVEVDIQCTPMFGGGVSGTMMRRLLADGNKEEFFKYIAVKSPEAKEEIWGMLTQQLTENFNHMLWRLISEAVTIDKQEVSDGQLGGPVSSGMNNEESDEDKEESEEGTGDVDINVSVDADEVDDKNISINIKVEESNTMSGGDIEGHLVGGKKQGTWAGLDVEAENAEQERLNKKNRGGIPKPKQDKLKELQQDAAEIINLEKGLQLARGDLPQIKSTDVSEFMSWLEKEKGVESFNTSLGVDELTPIQKEINITKAKSMVEAHQAGKIDLYAGKPVMVSRDEHLIDGHHRWYALGLMQEDVDLDIVMINLDVEDLLEIMKEFPKTSFKEPHHENKFMDALFSTLLEETEGLDEGYENFGGSSQTIKVGNIRVDIEDLELEPTKHGEERRYRHQQGGKGHKISKDAIIQAVDRAMGLIMNDYANGELDNDEAFHIRMKGKSRQVPALNVIGVLNMQ